MNRSIALLTYRSIGSLAVLVFVIGLTMPVGLAARQQAATEAQLFQRIQQDPNDVAAHLDLARLQYSQGRVDEAQRVLERALTLIRAERVAAMAGVARDPNAPVRVGGGIQEPKKIKHVGPVYPQEAQQARVQGVVILEVMIDPEGRVSDAKVLRSVSLLDQAAVDAVRQWEFTPTVLNGVAVPVVMTVTVNFTLG